jgi:hypothetical protein
MGGVNAFSVVKIKPGALEKRAIQPRVCPMERCAAYRLRISPSAAHWTTSI